MNEQPTINQLTEDELTALAVQIVGARSRNTGPGWDRYGVTQVLRSIGHEPAELIRTAALKAANDPTADTPITITWNKYRPKINDTQPEPDHGPKCSTCGRTQRMCLEVRAKEERYGVPDPHDFIAMNLDRYRRPAHA